MPPRIGKKLHHGQRSLPKNERRRNERRREMSEEKSWVTDLGDGTHQVRTCVWSPPGDHPVGCGIIVTVKDNKIVKVVGDPTHPITHGRL